MSALHVQVVALCAPQLPIVRCAHNQITGEPTASITVIIIVPEIATRILDVPRVLTVTMLIILMKKEEMNVLSVRIHVLLVPLLIIVSTANLVIGEHTVRVVVKDVLHITVISGMAA